MNILITGSNGFVGSKLMWELENKGHKVIGIDISDHCDAKPHPATLRGDIRDPGDLEKAGSEFSKKHGAPLELIIHCAASKHDFGIKRAEYFSHNKYGTRSLLDFASQHAIRKLLYVSSVSVFGHPVGMSDEVTPYAPDQPYGESKLAGELACIEWQKQDSARELMVLRPAVIYGPHNFANVYKLIHMLHRWPWVTAGNGRHVKSVVSLDSFIDMILFSLDLMKPGYQHFNCVDEPNITLRELMGIIASNPGFRLPRVTIPLNLAVAIGRLFDIPAKIFSIDFPVNSDRMRKLGTETYFSAEKIRQAGFIQKRKIEDTISEMCEWYLRQG